MKQKGYKFLFLFFLVSFSILITETPGIFAQEIMPERELTIKMKGNLDEINRYCEAVGSLANQFEIETEFI